MLITHKNMQRMSMTIYTHDVPDTILTCSYQTSYLVRHLFSL